MLIRQFLNFISSSIPDTANPNRIFPSRYILPFLFALCFLFVLPAGLAAQDIHTPKSDDSPVPVPAAESDTPAWLEPRGLHVVDLVGLVPEGHLGDAIISYNGYGIAQYISGTRQGDTVTVRVRIHPRYFNANGQVITTVPCLGQRAQFDQWPSTVPASTVRFFDGGQDVTGSVTYLVYTKAGAIQPAYPINPGNPEIQSRYPSVVVHAPEFNQDGALLLPANNGCNLNLTGDFTDITAEFTYKTDSPITVDHLGSQSYTFRSYIGPGHAGRMESLQRQLTGRYPDRHDKFELNPPSGADYVLVTFPPMPANPYVWGDEARNMRQPTGGTYRLGRSMNNVLSVDHINTMGLPLYSQWQDADQAPNSEYLPYFSNPHLLASPEYFVPEGISYDPCMTNGGCPASLLDAIYQAEMTITVHYYRVQRTESGLTRVPLQQIGPAWENRSALGEQKDTPREQGQNDNLIHLPILFGSTSPPLVLPDDPTGCPCGWFDELGRMFDYIPRP